LLIHKMGVFILSNGNDGFVFYKSFLDAIKMLPKENQLDAFLAISEYAVYGTRSEADGLPMVVFTMAKPNIDSNIEKRQNGKSGGRPPKNKTEKPEVISKKTKTKFDSKAGFVFFHTNHPHIAYHPQH